MLHEASRFWKLFTRRWNHETFRVWLLPLIPLAWPGLERERRHHLFAVALPHAALKHKYSTLPRPQTHSAAHSSPHRAFPHIPPTLRFLHYLCCGLPPSTLLYPTHTFTPPDILTLLHASLLHGLTRSGRRCRFFVLLLPRFLFSGLFWGLTVIVCVFLWASRVHSHP